jgi:hypothetical protein
MTMLQCRDVATLASEYIDHDLPWRKRLAVRMHLMMCDACSRCIRQLRHVIAVAKRVRPKSVSDENAARSLFRAARRPEQAAGRGWNGPSAPKE